MKSSFPTRIRDREYDQQATDDMIAHLKSLNLRKKCLGNREQFGHVRAMRIKIDVTCVVTTVKFSYDSY